MWSRSPHRSALQILFRADGDARIGVGHLSRCVSLAQAFRRHVPCRVTFLVNRPAFLRALLPPSLKASVRQHSAFTGWPAGGRGKAIPEADILVADLPGLWPLETSQLRRRSRVLVCIDDGPSRHPEANLVVRPNLRATRSSADSDRPILSGADYLILRESFRRRPKRRWKTAVVRRLLVCFGGADPGGFTARVVDVLRSLDLSDALRTTLVLGPAFGPPDLIRRRTKEDPRFQLCRSAQDLVRGLRTADAAILSGGTLMYEAIVTGVPTLILSQTEDQEREATHLAKQGAVLALVGPRSGSPAALRRAITRLLGEPAVRQRLSDNALRVADGKGAERIVKAALDILQRAAP